MHPDPGTIMDTLVAQLQAQREELLAAHAAAGGRAAARSLEQQLKTLSEELELAAAAATTAPLPAALTPEFYASYMLVVLLAGNLCGEQHGYITMHLDLTNMATCFCGQERRAVPVEAHRARDQAQRQGAARRVGGRQGAVAAQSGRSLRRHGLRLVAVAAGAGRGPEECVHLAALGLGELT
ncbi:unnamed protein product [Phytophthora fragariaefolia]|uniref:Unnamed protein product n=1 Tax=Phytophthora fragariaefolia TaxID=1490495 RepID=A0A9W6XS61_9STRA|nr:unnamed protein product [Phytophthora fragariaefolia]